MGIIGEGTGKRTPRVGKTGEDEGKTGEAVGRIGKVAGMHQFSFSAIPILGPKTYVSPSGEYRLFINPSHRYGAGAALYRVTRDKTVLWEGERPFTLWQAGITDTGIVAGYGYSQGKEGYVGKATPGFGDFEVVLLAPDGTEQLHETTKRTHGLHPHTLPNPLASGLLVDSTHDRFVVRRHDENYNRGTETWQVYSLTTGQRQADLTFPKTRTAVGILVAELVPATPLTLLHWWRYVGGEPSQLGALFTLVDLTGKTVWSRALPTDYNLPGNEQAQYRLMQEIKRYGAILSTTPSQFTLRFAAQKQRVTFRVTQAPDGTWQVTESQRVPYVVPNSPPRKP